MNQSLLRMILLAPLALSIAGCAGAEDRNVTRAAATPTLSAREAQAILSMREEEKLARDVYTALGPKDPMFAMIVESENRHMTALLRLIERHGLTDPVANLPVGRFATPRFQSLHDTLVAQGSASTEAALLAGAEIEELDIADLEEQATTTTRPDVTRVFGRLTRGSRNHLRHFDAALSARGVKYTAKHLDPATYAAIVASPLERGPGHPHGRRGIPSD